MKIKLTYSQVKNALENGFISPLNNVSTIFDDYVKELTFAEYKRLKALRAEKKAAKIAVKTPVKRNLVKEAKSLGIKTGSIRRNSMKKINWLLDNSSEINVKHSVLGFDDCYRKDDEIKTDKSEVLDFISKTRSNYLDIYVTCDENSGLPTYLSVSGAHWDDSFGVNFNLENKQ